MKPLKQVEAAEAKRKKEIKLLEKKLETLRRTPNTNPFRCRKCGIAYKHNEIGFKKYRRRVTKMEYVGVGDYDVHQVEFYEYLGCCPKCGYNFGVKVDYDEHICSTACYDRHQDDKPGFQPEFCKCVSSEIKKVDEHQIRYMKRKG